MKKASRFLAISVLGVGAFFCNACVETDNYYSLGGLFPVPKLGVPSGYKSSFARPESKSSPVPDSKSELIATPITKKTAIAPKAHYFWNNPVAETIWENFIQKSERLSTQPRLGETDASHAEEILKTFGTGYMPNAYAHYQEARAKALEMEQTVLKTFPQGKISDPTGGKLLEKACRNLAVEVARMFRRHDELCFFLLLHKAGVFSETVLAKFDERPISINLDLREDSWSDDTPAFVSDITPEDATFAAKFMPETLSSIQQLSALFEEGAKQYRELRQTALAVDAALAHRNMQVLRTRIEDIARELKTAYEALSVWRIQQALGEVDASIFVETDKTKAAELQNYLKNVSLKTYFLAHSKTTDKTIVLSSGETMEMVWCPPNHSAMNRQQNANRGNQSQHQELLDSGFWLAKYEVTQKQWLSVMGYDPLNVSRDIWTPGQTEEMFTPKVRGDDVPVDRISWQECVDFCQKAGNDLTLPTGVEWEYACRAGSTGPYGGTGNLDEMGWYARNSSSRPHPVGQKLPNAWGLYDMHGNVLEWCRDATEAGHRVQRGGSWKSSKDECRSDSQHSYFHGAANATFGFRPCCPPDYQ